MTYGVGLLIIQGCMTKFGLEAWYKTEGRINKHMYKFIQNNLLWFTIQNYNLDPSRLVANMVMIPSIRARLYNNGITTLSTPSMARTISGLESY